MLHLSILFLSIFLPTVAGVDYVSDSPSSVTFGIDGINVITQQLLDDTLSSTFAIRIVDDMILDEDSEMFTVFLQSLNNLETSEATILDDEGIHRLIIHAQFHLKWFSFSI